MSRGGMLFFLLFFAAIITMTGCAPTIGRVSEDSIQLTGVADATLPDAAAMADAHCAQYGKIAKQAFDRIPDGKVLFECVN